MNKKKVLLGLLALTVAVGAALGLKYHHEGTGYNKGKCFVSADESVALIVVDAKDDVKAADGTMGTYLIQLEGLQMPMRVRGTAPYRPFNAAMKDAKEFSEVDCETGKPLK